MFMAAVAAGPVYKLLNAEGLGTDQMPTLNQPIICIPSPFIFGRENTR